MTALLDETIDDLTANERIAGLDPAAFPATPHVRLVSNAMIHELFSNGPIEGWPRFLEEYSGYWGFFRSTQVGFNRSKDQALIYLTYSCGPLCGEGSYMFLSKSDGVWRREDKLRIWIS
jgi:hypothetical protein